MSYSTYTEGDYDTIWKHYAYQTGLGPEWFYKVQLSNLLIMPYPSLQVAHPICCILRPCGTHDFLLVSAGLWQAQLLAICVPTTGGHRGGCAGSLGAPARWQRWALAKEVCVPAQAVSTARLACTGMVRTDLP